MTARAASPRKKLPSKEGEKASPAAIRVTRSIDLVPARPPTLSTLLAKAPPAQVGSGDDQPKALESPQAPGLPCSGRCGRCSLDPCRLHGGV